MEQEKETLLWCKRKKQYCGTGEIHSSGDIVLDVPLPVHTLLCISPVPQYYRKGDSTFMIETQDCMAWRETQYHATRVRQSFVLQEGDSVILRCLVDASPPAKVRRHTGARCRGPGVWSTGEEVVIPAVARETRGVYSCTAHNQGTIHHL